MEDMKRMLTESSTTMPAFADSKLPYMPFPTLLKRLKETNSFEDFVFNNSSNSELNITVVSSLFANHQPISIIFHAPHGLDDTFSLISRMPKERLVFLRQLVVTSSHTYLSPQLGAIIALFPFLTTLHLTDSAFSHTSFENTCASIGASSSLRWLFISKIIIEETSSLRNLANALVANTTIERLELIGCELTSAFISMILPAIGRKRPLRILNLSNNALTKDAASLIANDGLTELTLASNSLSTSARCDLLMALKINTTLQVLDFTYNSSPEYSRPADFACDFLTYNSTLRELKVSDIALHATDISHLLDSLSRNTSLKLLYMRHPLKADVAASMLAYMFNTNSTLFSLFINNLNIVYDIDLEYLVRAMNTNATLIYLHAPLIKGYHQTRERNKANHETKHTSLATLSFRQFVRQIEPRPNAPLIEHILL